MKKVIVIVLVMVMIMCFSIPVFASSDVINYISRKIGVSFYEDNFDIEDDMIFNMVNHAIYVARNETVKYNRDKRQIVTELKYFKDLEYVDCSSFIASEVSCHLDIDIGISTWHMLDNYDFGEKTKYNYNDEWKGELIAIDNKTEFKSGDILIVRTKTKGHCALVVKPGNYKDAIQVHTGGSEFLVTHKGVDVGSYEYIIRLSRK